MTQNHRDGGHGLGPVFVVGMNGSGTTMLLHCLRRHPRLYGFPGESKIIPRFIRKLDSYGDLSDDERYLKLWNDVRSAYPFRRYHQDTPVPLPHDWRSRGRSLGAVFDGVFGYFAETHGKVRWCEKTPMHAIHMSALAETFPEAVFVHMIRDGRDAAYSLRRRMRYAPELTMYRWKRVVREARRQADTLGERYMELRYEELTRDPEHWLSRIAEFIGEQYHTDMANPPAEWQAGPGDPNYHIVKAGELVDDGPRWSSYFSATQVARLESIGGELLSELGYPVRHTVGNDDPSFARRALMAWGGYGGEAFRTIRRISSNSTLSPLSRARMILGRGWTQLLWWITNRSRQGRPSLRHKPKT